MYWLLPCGSVFLRRRMEAAMDLICFFLHARTRSPRDQVKKVRHKESGKVYAMKQLSKEMLTRRGERVVCVCAVVSSCRRLEAWGRVCPAPVSPWLGPIRHAGL